MRHSILVLGLVLMGCSKNDKEDKGNTTGPSTGGNSWVVGDDGEMLRMAASGEVEPYPLDSDADLLGIACVGDLVAWVVGSGGTVLSTGDGGQHWASHALGSTDDLLAVAAVGDEHTGTSAVVVAGAGVLRMAGADGVFADVAAPARDWTAVALDLGSGTRILAAADDGSLWRSNGASAAERVLTLEDRSLSGVAFMPGGERAVVVGSEGTMALSDDGGRSWTAVDTGTDRDLYAVRMSTDGASIIAVGAAGVVVTVGEDGTTAHEHLDPALSLRGLHVGDDGSGHAVGDAGVVLETDDYGRTWAARDVGTNVVLRGVDDVHGHAH